MSPLPFKDPERAKQYNREYYQKNKEKIKLRSKQWTINNREQHLKNRRKYYRKNKESHYNGVKKSRKKHIKKTRECNRRAVAKVKREAAAKIGIECALCGDKNRLCFHQKHYKEHKRGVSGWYEARKHPEDFIRLCFKCHIMVHTLYAKFNIRFEELKSWLVDSRKE